MKKKINLNGKEYSINNTTNVEVDEKILLAIIDSFDYLLYIANEEEKNVCYHLISSFYQSLIKNKGEFVSVEELDFYIMCNDYDEGKDGGTIEMTLNMKETICVTITENPDSYNRQIDITNADTIIKSLCN